MVNLLFISIGVNAQNLPNYFMKSLEDCNIVIEDIEQELRDMGLTKNIIEAEVLDMFNEAGLKYNPKSFKYLYIHINSFELLEENIAYSIRVSLFHYFLYVDTYVTTQFWEKEYLGEILKRGDYENVINDVNTVLDLFKADFIVNQD